MNHIRQDAIERACKVVIEWKPTLGGSQPLGILISNEIEAAVRKFVGEAFEEAAAICDSFAQEREAFLKVNTSHGDERRTWVSCKKSEAERCRDAIRARAKEAPK